MTDGDITERLRAVERALTDADTEVADLSEAAAVHERLDELAADVETLAERLDALDATVQSLHGYVGELEHVNDRVERRADAARAAVERLDDQHLATSERADLDDEGTSGGSTGRPENQGAHGPETTATRSPGTRTDASTDDVDAASHALLDAAADDCSDGEETTDESLLDRVRESL